MVVLVRSRELAIPRWWIWSVRLAWREARPVVQVVFLLRLLAGVCLAGTAADEVPAARVATGALAWLATTWAIYLLNGVADVVEDRANGLARPIARGDLDPDTATRVVWLLAAAGLVLGAAVSVTMLVIVALMLAVGWAYSMGPRPLKRTMAGFAIAVIALGLLTYLAGWAVAGVSVLPGPVLLFGAMMSLWMGFAGSTKDLADAVGDRLAGRRTLPVLLGEQPARVVMAVAASLVGWAFVACASASGYLLPVAIVVAVGSVALALVALGSAGTGGRSTKRRPYQVFMTTQYAAHLTLFTCLQFA
ncbi:UbiA family prenyltransferase [Actinokineospora inagensis]|uniref:UbiA family prenyltransferase n=1 Tax=Actinokineospora inagensis TaxID=103730 RepID=UPI0004116A3F|nr:UbiA family prenyltransferase [Actinokineospora inagensis]